MNLPANSPFMPALIEYRKAALSRRAAAFCDAPEYVFGLPVLPLTPRTFSMLVAIRSPFVCGGVPMEGDVRNYLFFHSPHYCAYGSRFFRLRKGWALLRFRLMLGRKRNMDYYAGCLALAASDIKALVDDAFADNPPSRGATSAPTAALESEMVCIFAREFGWTPERTRNTPLRQLFQHTRCIAVSRGQEINDAGEEAILEAHIKLRNAEAAEARKLAEVS